MNEFIMLQLENEESVGFSVEWNGKGYNYLKKIGTDVSTIGVDNRKPSELSEATKIGKIIKKYINKIETGIDGVSINEKISKETSLKDVLIGEYIYLMKELDKIIKKEFKEVKKAEAREKKQVEVYYNNLYTRYCERRDSYNYSDLQFIGQISLGMGVGLHNIILKMFINHLLTITKIKPSNQLVHSKQASGKSFIIDQTLRLIPSKFVKNGRSTSAFFFNEFDKQDVSGCIFNFGDLGGDNDNENTIEVRDLVKILNTDGVVERGLIVDGKPTKQVVTGYPSLTYSTVDPDIINSQEKSRGSVFSPPLIDEYQLTTYNSIIKSPGIFKSTIDLINDDIESVKGFVWNLKDNLLDYELFNPYMFNVTSFLSSMDDFNRKINEFDMTLLVVTYLNNPFVLEHSLYGESKKLMIASKQDVINALALFEGKDNLLPNYRLCIQNIAKEYSMSNVIDYYEDPDKYNEYITNTFEPDVFYCENKYDKKILSWNNAMEEESTVYFTISDIRKKFKKNKWFQRVKNNLSEVLRSLNEYGYLLKIEYGKLEGENIYALPLDIENKLSTINLVWDRKNLNKGVKLFSETYPSLVDDFNSFISEDKKLNIRLSNLELDSCNIYDLVWERINDNDLPPTESKVPPSETKQPPTEEKVPPTETLKWYEESYF